MYSGLLFSTIVITSAWPWGELEFPTMPTVAQESSFLSLFQIPDVNPQTEKLLPPTSAGLAWMTDPSLFEPQIEIPRFSIGEMAEVLDRQTSRQNLNWSPGSTPSGLFRDPDRWRFKGDLSDSLYRRTVKVEVPDPVEVYRPYSGRDWKAEDKFQIPVPIALPIAEQLFVYGQFGGNGDALNNRTTTLTGKTGVGMKWSPLGSSEVQLRYGTLINYADVFNTTRFQEKAQPAIELMARLPLVGAWQLEYTGAALPALQTSDHDQVRQELRLAVPLGKGDNEFEFGARYRWDVIQTPTPWLDRAQLFMGLKFRH